MNPSRDDRETLLARLADAERRAAQAEARARAAEAAAKRPRRGLWLTAAADELLVVETRDGLVFVEPGRAVLGMGRRRVVGSLPSARAAVVLRARAIPTRDGAADLDATVLVGVGADRDRREAATRQFLDRPAFALADAAAPVLEAALRSVLGIRAASDLAALDRIALDLRLSAQGALRDLGLDVGEVQLARAGGEVRA